MKLQFNSVSSGEFDFGEFWGVGLEFIDEEGNAHRHAVKLSPDSTPEQIESQLIKLMDYFHRLNRK